MIRMPDSLRWEDVEEGSSIPPVTLHVSYLKVAMVPMATWDMFPGHHNPAYAAHQGQKDIYLNTTVLQGFADRVLTDWAGPSTFIARRKLTMMGSVHPGDQLIGTGQVTRVYVDQGCHKIDASITLTTHSGAVCEVETTAILPSRAAV
jgi:hypothetical protein